MGTGISTNRFLSPSGVSEGTKSTLLCLLQELPHMTPGQVVWAPIESFLSTVPKGENILAITGPDGYNLLQWAVGLQSIELVRWLLSHDVDVNRGSCSLPIHIAALTGNVEMTDLLLRNGARTEIETRMCFPGPHSKNCELRKHGQHSSDMILPFPRLTMARGIDSITRGHFQTTDQQTTIHRPWPFSDKVQNSMTYAIDGDQAEILELLLDSSSGRKYFWNRSRPLLLTAFERRAWNCVKFLLPNRQDEVNVSNVSKLHSDEYYPIHEAVIHEDKFVHVLLQCNVDITVRTVCQQSSVLHVLLLRGRKSASDTINTLRLLFDHGAKELINEPDLCGNTPLHALILRYALEKVREQNHNSNISHQSNHQQMATIPSYSNLYNSEINQGSANINQVNEAKPWTKWDMLHVLQFMLQNKAGQCINAKGNSVLACVIRHIKDWDFRYELLCMLLENGRDPNMAGGRDGSVPLVISLVPLLNPGKLMDTTHKQRVSFINSVRILCKFGANPNCSLTQSNNSGHHQRKQLTPLQMLVFISNEYIQHKEEEKEIAFPFITSLLIILANHGLDLVHCQELNVLKSIASMAASARKPSDLKYVTDLMLTLIKYGADPNTCEEDSEPTFCSSQGSVFIKKPTNYVLFYFIQQLIKKEDMLIFIDSDDDGDNDDEADARQNIHNHDQRVNIGGRGRRRTLRREDTTFVSMIELLYNSMDHNCLMACLKELIKQSTMGPLTTNSVTLKETLKRMLSTPRSLKSISRHAIYKSLNHKMVPKVSKLDLPPRIKQYLLDFKS